MTNTTTTTKPRAVVTRRSFREVDTGWLDTRSGHVFATAHAALQAARRESTRNADGSGIGAVVIEWEPTTWMGRTVVEVLAKGD